MADTNPIARSEAVWRLKTIGSKITQCVQATRDGCWQESVNAANEAWELLSNLLPHLEEAERTAPSGPLLGSLAYGTPPARTGGMGYRGSAGNSRLAEHDRQREFFKDRATPQPIVHATPFDGPPEPIPTPTVRTKTARPKPIVTPPPVLKLEETRTFDLSRIVGQQEWFTRSQAEVPNDPTDWEMTDAFNRLDNASQERIVKKYHETGTAVTL